MKINKYQLQDIRSQAIRNFVDLNKGELTEHEFQAKCWLEACSAVLKVNGLEYPVRSIVEPAEE